MKLEGLLPTAPAQKVILHHLAQGCESTIVHRPDLSRSNSASQVGQSSIVPSTMSLSSILNTWRWPGCRLAEHHHRRPASFRQAPLTRGTPTSIAGVHASSLAVAAISK
eukprot:TRINITY_DN94570_c0_g1_i1.p1 TRINITY_DN94570_c0_g1~~TRINITY_DN94570_c0_g1_i1.p1  ORF type:complete len:109 (+),score=4.96 TRINITY_DN94570_c0_g1_i1:258-584(+)